jgi:hypothetical protein
MAKTRPEGHSQPGDDLLTVDLVIPATETTFIALK